MPRARSVSALPRRSETNSLISLSSVYMLRRSSYAVPWPRRAIRASRDGGGSSAWWGDPNRAQHSRQMAQYNIVVMVAVLLANESLGYGKPSSTHRRDFTILLSFTNFFNASTGSIREPTTTRRASYPAKANLP